ncbi:MAG: GNAT family N-acetyltransferase [Fimbriimonas sp.]|nr:GNAT family N-acetyltransferase [Fimbriimonas sp.]
MKSSKADYRIRGYDGADRAGVNALGSHVVDWWHRDGSNASLHQVALAGSSSEIVGHLQVRDRGVPEPSRRPGQCHFSLIVAARHRRRGIGASLYARLEAFAFERDARQLWTAYRESANNTAAWFLKSRGFRPLERYFPSTCDLLTFDPKDHWDAVESVETQGIELITYAQLGDSLDQRRRLYALEESARSVQPFRGVGPYVPTAYEWWEAEFLSRDPTAVLIARELGAKELVGVVTGLQWYFTATHPDWCGRGIATALKVRCMQEAKARGIERMETENHEDNAGMLKINRRLGFVFGEPEVACVKQIRPDKIGDVCV